MKESCYRRVVAASAWYDLAVTVPLATPWTLDWFLSTFAELHARLGLAGEVPVYGASIGLFGNLLGSVVVVWSLARLRSRDPALGRFDAAARFLFSAWMIYATLHGMSSLLLVFIIPELAWGIVQSLPVQCAQATRMSAKPV